MANKIELDGDFIIVEPIKESKPKEKDTRSETRSKPKQNSQIDSSTNSKVPKKAKPDNVANNSAKSTTLKSSKSSKISKKESALTTKNLDKSTSSKIAKYKKISNLDNDNDLLFNIVDSSHSDNDHNNKPTKENKTSKPTKNTGLKMKKNNSTRINPFEKSGDLSVTDIYYKKCIKIKKKQNKKQLKKPNEDPKRTMIFGLPADFNLGKKLKDIPINLKKHKISSLILLITLNLALTAIMIYFLHLMFRIYILIIALLTIIACFSWSIATFKYAVLKIHYSIYEYAVVRDFDTSINIGALTEMTGFRVSETLLDRLGKHKTKTLTLYFDNNWCRKIVFPYITTNIDKLANYITTLSTQAKISKPRKKETSIIEKLIIKTK